MLNLKTHNWIVVLVIFQVYVLSYAWSQGLNNNCANATVLCPGQIISDHNYNANVTLCPGCEDDFNFCFTPHNTVWFQFTTNATGGMVQIDVTNLNFQTNPGQDNELQATLIYPTLPCSANSYTQLGNCISNSGTAFSLLSPVLNPLTTYYVVISGDQSGAGVTAPAQASFDIQASGPGIDRPVPQIQCGLNTTNSCLNDVIFATAYLTDCPDSTTFIWRKNGQIIGQTDLNTFAYSDFQDGDVLSVETTCFTVCVQPIFAQSPPINVYSFNVDAGPDVSISAGTSIALNGATTAAFYYWQPSFLVSDSSVLTPWVSPVGTTVYTLVGVDNGCTISDQVTVTVSDEFLIPSSFSPNGDGVNDTWVINGIEKYPDCQLVIYNRWGQEVFQATGYSTAKAWKGTNKQGELVEGVFYYILDFKNELPIQKGSITLIR